MKPEEKIETHLYNLLVSKGFKCLKLTTPGNSYVMDRLILPPKGTPKGVGPWFLEVKAPGKEPRRAQELTALDWLERGCHVLPYVDTIEKVNERVNSICDQVHCARTVARMAHWGNKLTLKDNDTMGCV